jgi:nucleoside-diphosphate-sugar epimerase
MIMPIALVTGGAGFIGSHLVRSLLKNNWQVRVLDNFSTGKKENLSGLNNKIEVLESDLRNTATVKDSVRDADVIFHEAAFISVPQSMMQPGECFDVNIRGTENLLQAAKDAGVKRIVIASSAAVYGDTNSIPLSEDLQTRCLSPYAASKNINEILADLYTRAFRLEVTCLRYFNVFGPRQRPDSQYAAAIPIFIQNCHLGDPITIHGDGNQTRDLIYIADVVRANLIAAEHPAAPGRVFNICTGHETRVIDLVEEVQRLYPKSSSPVFVDSRPGDIYRSVGNPTRALTELGFQAEISLAEGLQATVEWMQC